MSWPFLNGFRHLTNLTKYALLDPALFLGSTIESLLYGSTPSTTEVVEKNIQALLEQNKIYQEQLDQLESTAATVLSLTEMAHTLTEEYNQEIIEDENKLKALQLQLQEIVDARAQINIGEVYASAQKVTDYILTHLNDPTFIENLKLNDQRMTKILTQLDTAHFKLAHAQKTYEEKISEIESLTNEYTKLGQDLKEHLAIYKKQAENRIQKLNTPTPLQ